MNLSCDEKDDVFWKVPPLRPTLFLENGATGFEVRWLNIGKQALHEPCSESFFEALDVRRAGIGGEDHLTARTLESIKGVEKLLLGRLFTADELNIVEKEDVNIPEGLPEEVEVFRLKTVNELVDELFRREVDGADVSVFFDGLVGDRVKKVCFSQA